MRATMSLPGVFPPVERDGRVLVDGGILDNIPADVVRELGAQIVIAVDVGYAPTESVDYSMFGLLGRTVDVMMRTSTRAALAHADMTIAIDVEGFGSLDWRRSVELIERGHQAAEKRRVELLKYRVSDDEWKAWLAGRERRRRTTIPEPAFVTTSGVAPADSAVVQRALEPHLNVPLDVPSLERDLASLTGLDRYQAIDWQLTDDGGRTGLLVRAREKAYAPPFFMLGLNIENTTSEDFRVRLAARYLRFDVAGSGSELRVDGAIGADPSFAVALYKPIVGTRVFARPIAAVQRRTFGIVNDGAIIAEYTDNRFFVGGDLGVNLSRVTELAGGVWFGHVKDHVRAGNPGLPELSGPEITAALHWTIDQQDSPVIPSHGTRAVAVLTQTFTSPELRPAFVRTNRDLTQAEAGMSYFFSPRPRQRLFAVANAGTSFDDLPLPTRQFSLGYPFVLDAFSVGEHRGDHFAVLTVGAMQQIARLPDFMGGPIFLGSWFQNGSAFNTHEDADINSHLAVGIVMDTLVGPVLVASSFGLDGGWRMLFGVGRIFR